MCQASLWLTSKVIQLELLICTGIYIILFKIFFVELQIRVVAQVYLMAFYKVLHQIVRIVRIYKHTLQNRKLKF